MYTSTYILSLIPHHLVVSSPQSPILISVQELFGAHQNFQLLLVSEIDPVLAAPVISRVGIGWMLVGYGWMVAWLDRWTIDNGWFGYNAWSEWLVELCCLELSSGVPPIIGGCRGTWSMYLASYLLDEPWTTTPCMEHS